MEDAEFEARHLRSAIEFAVLMARESQKVARLKSSLTFPDAFKRYAGGDHVPTRALPSLVRAIEGDDALRRKLAAGAVPDLVDEVGRLWLAQPEGWRDEVARLIREADTAAAEAEAASALKKTEKRRLAAEQVAARTRAEIVTLQAALDERDTVIDQLRAANTSLTDEVESVRAELTAARTDARHARDRERAAIAKVTAAEAGRAAAVESQGAAESLRDEVLADRAAITAERSELARLADVAASLAEQLKSVSTPSGRVDPAPARRTAIPMPGGVMGDSDAAADYLMRSGAVVLVDGYNVAKLAWPTLDLERQRAVLLDTLENLVRRYGNEVTVVFDGADVVGATATRRRIVRVVYSPSGVLADDVIRDEVRRLPATRQVVVVTNDREIVRDVRAMGANTMRSEQLVALVR